MPKNGYKGYLDAVEDAFSGQVDYAQLVKIYNGSTGESKNERKYSPAECTDVKKVKQLSNHDKNHVSTSHIEITMRIHMRRFNRLTNAFSKKIENNCYSIELHFIYYNFVKIHQTLRVTLVENSLKEPPPDRTKEPPVNHFPFLG